MTTTTTSKTTSATAPVTPISKYRVHVRDIAASQGWKLSQTDTRTDVFHKGNETVHVTYGATQVVGAGHMAGKTIKDQSVGTQASKLQRVSTWLGVPMELKAKWNLKHATLDELEARAAKEIRVIEVPAPAETKA